MTPDRPTVLLTGATGVLGRALIDEFAADHHLLCLRRKRPVNDPRVADVTGDLCRPQFGLDAGPWRELGRRVDIIVHCGAATNWRAPREEILATNIDGTRTTLDLAAEAGAPVHHVSTAFVVRTPPKAIGDDGVSGGIAAYLESKRAAEKLVVDSGLMASIVRPSILIGDSATGRIESFQGIHKVMAAVYRGQLPVLPAAAEAFIDFVPQDVVARAIGRLARLGAREGVLWLTAGQDALNVGQMLDVTLDIARRDGREPVPPRLIPTEAVYRLLLPLLDDVASPAIRRQFRAFCELMLLFQGTHVLPSSLDTLGMGADAAHAALREAFAVSIGYWAAGRAGGVRTEADLAAAG